MWDTTLAARALNRLPPKGNEIIDGAFEWIWTKQLSDGSFDGEPWDTLFVCLAALETGRTDRILRTLEWLVSLQGHAGALISKHYTGLFCEVLGLGMESTLPSALRQKLHEAAIRALHSLWDGYSAENLWTGGTWTNAYVIRGILALKHPQILGKYDEILRWFAGRLSERDAWDDVVRTAIVLRALLELKLHYELEKCNRKPLHDLTVQFFASSTQSELLQGIQSRVEKAPLVVDRKLVERDETGSYIVTLTPDRQLYLAIVFFVLGLAWSIFENQELIRRFLFP
ncbi:MAG: hypothetical protein ACREQA_04200 [Candidatus Binatia bacterium]